jgi:hypothetical protein
LKSKIIIGIVSVTAFFAFGYLGNGKLNTIVSGVQLKESVDNGLNKTFYPKREELGRTREDYEKYYDEKLKQLVEPGFEKGRGIKSTSSLGQQSNTTKDDNEREHFVDQEGQFLSEEMKTLSMACSKCVDILHHVNLMNGNRFSDQQLFNIAGKPDESEQLEYLKQIFVSRMALSAMSQVSYDALAQYEQNVLGNMVPPDELMKVVETYEFKTYLSYLVDSGIIKDFCKENPKILSCIRATENLKLESTPQSYIVN